MEGQHTTPMSVLDAIYRVARRANALRASFRWFVRISLPSTAASLITALYASQTNSRPAGLCSVLLFLLPIIPMAIWVMVEQEHLKTEQESLRKALRKVRELFVPEHSDARQVAPPAAIGPLLDATLVSAINGIDVKPEAALLGALLKSIRAEDEVVLTEDQRELLHELVMPGRWTWIRGYTYQYVQQMVAVIRRELRPASIGALGLLGNRFSISVLQRFARTTDDSELYQAALDSMDQIRQRLQYGPEQMLRAAKATESVDQLLKPVSAEDTHVPTEELLRPKQ